VSADLRRFRAYALGVIGGLGVLYAIVSRLLLHAFPFSGDEYSTLLQASIFARGLLHTPAPAHAELFRVDHVVIDTLVRSKYPAGAAALLSLGVRAGVAWLVTPVEGVITLLFAWKAAKTLLEPRHAFITVALLGWSPLFLFNSASFYSHTAATMWLAAGFAALAQWTQDRRAVWLFAIGATLGCTFLTRPLDAVLFGAALLSFRSLRVVAFAVAGALPFFLIHLAYQDAQFGSPLADGYHAYAATFTDLYGKKEGGSQLSPLYAIDPIELYNHLDVLRAFLLDWTVPGTALLAVFGGRRLWGEAKTSGFVRFSVTLIGLFVFVFLFTMAGADDGARPRYLSTPLLPVTFLAGPGWYAARDILRERLGRRTVMAIAVLVGVLPAAMIASFIERRMPKLFMREGLQATVASKGIVAGIVIVRAQYPTRYARNGPFFDDPVLYVSPPAKTTVADVAEAFPAQPLYEAREPQYESWDNDPPWRIERVK
jgi:hypothetical protein